jgi:hypothetical protein
MQTPSMDEFPILLCVPGIKEPAGEHILPLGVEDYQVIQQGDLWKVVVKATGELIYAGPGPATVRRSRAPF